MADIFDQFTAETQTETQTEAVPPQGDIFSQFQEEELAKPQGIMENVKGVGQHFGRRFLSEALASPKSLAEFVQFGSQYLAEKGVEQQLKAGKAPDPGQLKFTETVLKGLGFPAELLDKIGYPSADRFEEMIKDFAEFTGGEGSQAPLEPRTGAEKAARTVGGFAGSSVLGGPKKLAQRLLFGTAAGAGAAGAEALGFEEGGQLGAAFAVPALLSLGAQIKSGSFKPSSKQLQSLKQFGKEIGLTEEQLVPILQNEGKIGALGKAAKPTKKTAELFKGTEEALGKEFEQLKGRAAKTRPANRKMINQVTDSFDEIETQLSKSKMPGDDKLSAMKKIREASARIADEGFDASDIIETYRDINRTVNWNSYAGGKKDLAKLKQPLKDILKESYPEVGKDFEKLNQLFSKFKNVEKSIGLDKYKEVANYGKYFAVLGGLSSAVGTGNVKKIPAILGSYLTVELAQKLATKMLTDKKYQNILIKSANAVKNSSRSMGLKAFNELRDQLVEDFPEEAKEVDWKELQKDSLQRK